MRSTLGGVNIDDAATACALGADEIESRLLRRLTCGLCGLPGHRCSCADGPWVRPRDAVRALDEVRAAL